MSSEGRPLKIDIVVHGRFHAFALAHALLEIGHDVALLTNYPASVARRFGLPVEVVRSNLLHGLASRTAARFAPNVGEAALHQSFGRWANRTVRRDADCVYGFSGVMLELLKSKKSHPRQVRLLVRGSSHIRRQHELLIEEEARSGVDQDKPSQWRIDREEQEYALADYVVVLSSFAAQSFTGLGFDPARLIVNALGADPRSFRADASASEERQRRILGGAPLRVLTVGAFSYRKGALDLAEIASRLAGQMTFTFVGQCPAEAWHLATGIRQKLRFIPRVPEPELAGHYASADLFLFPTIEDGAAAVILQASAAGLPILATPHCAAPDILVEGKTGFVLPVRSPESFIQKLQWCDQNRPALAAMANAAAAAAAGSGIRNWRQTADELVRRVRPATTT